MAGSAFSSAGLAGLAGVEDGYAPLDSGLLVPFSYLPLAAGVSENFLTGDVTMTNADTVYDGPSLSLPAGDYLIYGRVAVLLGNAGAYVNARLLNGSTVEDEAGDYGDTFHLLPIDVFGHIVLVATTTVKVSAIANASGVTKAAIRATNNTNGTTNKASHLMAHRIG